MGRRGQMVMCGMVVLGSALAGELQVDLLTPGAIVLGSETRTNWPPVPDFGVSDSTAYRGDWGEAVSNLAALALPTTGGAMTGTLAMGTNALVFKDVANATNLIIMHSGLLDGTNGIYFAAPNGSNYWILFK